jgi:HD-GYP domain-containing protein (c-di-GMP phosphodiesterase class II)
MTNGMRQAAEAPEGASPIFPANLARLGRELVVSLHVAVKTAKIHSHDNEAFLNALYAFLETGNAILREQGSAALIVVGDYLFLNETRLKIDANGYQSFRWVVQELGLREIGSLTWAGELSEETAKRFVLAMLKPPAPADPRAEFSGALHEGAVPIEAGPPRPAEEISEMEKTSIDRKEKAKKTFFKAVAVTRQVMNNVKLGKASDVRRAKRAVQAMVDLILEEEFSLLGMTTLKDYDAYTFYHSVNVSIIAITLGKRLGLSRKQLSELGVAALFHDIGKVMVPREVLNKEGQFEKNEWDIMKMHPDGGVRMLLKLRGFNEIGIRAMIAAFEHHQHFDLSGYPQTRKKLPLTLTGRIVSIADCFDAMTSRRIYMKKANPRDKAISYMMAFSGTYFDPILMKVFVNMVGLYPIGALLRLSSGELAVVLEGTGSPNDVLLPKVKIITDRNGIEADGGVVDLREERGREDGRAIVECLDPVSMGIDISKYFI